MRFFTTLLGLALIWGFAVRTMAQTTYTQLTNIPTLYVNTTSGSDPADKETYLPCTVVLVDGDNTTTYSLTDDGVRGRGNSTWAADKKPWRLKFNKKVEFLGSDFAKAKSWTLLANAYDRSLMRNALTYHLGKFVGLEFCPAYKFVDLVMNGTYRGTYQISDQVEVRKKRVDVNEDTGWLLEYANANDKVDDPKIDLQLDGSSVGWVQVKNPEVKSDDWTNNPTLQTAISTYLNTTLGEKIKQSTTGYHYVDPFTGYRAVVDTASLINWYIATEITANWDGFYSIYSFREADDEALLHLGPMWDEDLAYGNHQETYSYVTNYYQKLLVDCNFSSQSAYPTGYRKMQPVVKHLWDDPWFANAVKMHLDALLAEGLQSYLENAVDDMKTELTQSADKNFDTWSIANAGGQDYGDSRTWTSGRTASWSNAVSYLRSFIGTRLSLLKTKFADNSSNNRYLPEELDNTAKLSAANGKTLNVVLNRTAKAGTWNTICLPFPLNSTLISYLFGEGSVVEEFSGVTITDGMVSLNFKAVSAMQSGVPYLVRPTRDVDRPFSFLNVSLKSAAQTVTHNGYSFTGIYAPTQLKTDGTDLFVASGNLLKRPTANSKPLKAFRAYFTLPSTAAAAKTSLNIEGETTGIDDINTSMRPGQTRVYNLNGQYVGNSLDGLSKGIYVVNGKKIVKR